MVALYILPSQTLAREETILAASRIYNAFLNETHEELSGNTTSDLSDDLDSLRYTRTQSIGESLRQRRKVYARKNKAVGGLFWQNSSRMADVNPNAWQEPFIEPKNRLKCFDYQRCHFETDLFVGAAIDDESFFKAYVAYLYSFPFEAVEYNVVVLKQLLYNTPLLLNKRKIGQQTLMRCNSELQQLIDKIMKGVIYNSPKVAIDILYIQAVMVLNAANYQLWDNQSMVKGKGKIPVSSLPEGLLEFQELLPPHLDTQEFAFKFAYLDSLRKRKYIFTYVDGLKGLRSENLSQVPVSDLSDKYREIDNVQEIWLDDPDDHEIDFLDESLGASNQLVFLGQGAGVDSGVHPTRKVFNAFLRNCESFLPKQGQTDCDDDYIRLFFGDVADSGKWLGQKCAAFLKNKGEVAELFWYNPLREPDLYPTSWRQPYCDFSNHLVVGDYCVTFRTNLFLAIAKGDDAFLKAYVAYLYSWPFEATDYRAFVLRRLLYDTPLIFRKRLFCQATIDRCNLELSRLLEKIKSGKKHNPQKVAIDTLYISAVMVLNAVNYHLWDAGADGVIPLERLPDGLPEFKEIRPDFANKQAFAFRLACRDLESRRKYVLSYADGLKGFMSRGTDFSRASHDDLVKAFCRYAPVDSLRVITLTNPVPTTGNQVTSRPANNVCNVQ